MAEPSRTSTPASLHSVTESEPAAEGAPAPSESELTVESDQVAESEPASEPEIAAFEGMIARANLRRRDWLGKEIRCDGAVANSYIYWPPRSEYRLYPRDLRPHCFAIAIVSKHFGFLLHINNPTRTYDDQWVYVSALEGATRKFQQWWDMMMMPHAYLAEAKLYSFTSFDREHEGQSFAAFWFISRVKEILFGKGIPVESRLKEVIFGIPTGRTGANVKIVSYGDMERSPRVFANGVDCDSRTVLTIF